MEHETTKLKQCDEILQRELKEWKAQLLPRKQVIDWSIFLTIKHIAPFAQKKKINA